MTLLPSPGVQAMDLDALIQQLNTVDSEAIRWQALAESTGSQPDAAQTTDPQAQESPPPPTWVIAAPLLQRLQDHLGLSSPDEEPETITAILENALEAWLQAHET